MAALSILVFIPLIMNSVAQCPRSSWGLFFTEYENLLCLMCYAGIKNCVYACTDRPSITSFVICKELLNWADKVDISKDKYSWWDSNAHLHFSSPLCICHSHQFDTYHTVRNKVMHFHPNIKHAVCFTNFLQQFGIPQCLHVPGMFSLIIWIRNIAIFPVLFVE